MDALLRDLRYALRSLKESPLFTLVAILTLGLGIGANTAIFSVVNAVLLRPLPFSEPDELVLLTPRNDQLGIDSDFVSPLEFSDWREQQTALADLSAYWPNTQTLTESDSEPLGLDSVLVTANHFQLLGVQPAAGRLFTADDGNPGASNVAVLSHELWQSRFGGDESVVGRTITLEGNPVEVVGVLKPGRTMPAEADVFTNINFPLSGGGSRRARWLSVIGRHEPGGNLEQTEAEMRGLAAQIAQDFPESNEGWTVDARSLTNAVVGDLEARLWLLLGASGLILLIACANVANLLLSRAEARQREIAVRAALGARRQRIARQLLTESFLLATLGALAGAFLAFVGVRLLLAFAPPELPRLDELSLDPRVLPVLAASAAITGLVFGLAPLLRLRRLDLTSSLKEGVKGTASRERMHLRNVFVVSQVAVAVVLVIGAGLLIKSFAKLRAVDPGFQTAGRITFELDLPGSSYADDEAVTDLYRRLGERLRALPGVRAVGFGSTLPLGESLDYYKNFGIEGRVPADGEEFQIYFRQVDPGFFDALGIPMVGGRPFTDRDRLDAPGVVILNEAAVRRFFPNDDPVGERVTNLRSRFGPLGAMLKDEAEIVGVVRDVRYAGLQSDPNPSLYLPTPQAPFRRMAAVISTQGDPNRLLPTVRQELAALDPGLPLSDVRTMDQRLAASLAEERFALLLLSLFAGLALLLAAVGIYGVLSYTVEQRTSEVGVRMALGATGPAVLGMVLRQGMVLISIGLGLGLFAAFAGTRLLASQLYGVEPLDPWVFAGVALLLGTVALAASYVPARRATQIDPLVALRYD